MPLLIFPVVLVVAFLWFVFRKRPVKDVTDAVLEHDALASSRVGALKPDEVRTLPSTALSRSR